MSEGPLKILYFHGWQSVPGGVKPSYLRDRGFEVIEPSLPDDDFGEAMRIAEAFRRDHRPDVIVGSSRGGSLGMNIDSGDTPLVLLCPAWKRWGSARTVKSGTVILHAVTDETIPYADSLELLQNSGLPDSALITTGSIHRLTDDDSLRLMAEAAQSQGRVHPGR